MNKLNFNKALSRASTLKANFRQWSGTGPGRCLPNQFKVDGGD